MRKLFLFAVFGLVIAAVAQQRPSLHQELPPAKFQIHALRFDGVEHISRAEQDTIVAGILHWAGTQAGGVSLEQLREQIRGDWKDRGYFKAEVSPTVEMIECVAKCFANVTAHITEGAQYRLSSITFKGTKVFPGPQLRPIFPLQDGEIFATSKIREGLENMRKAYARVGYINFTAGPDTQIHEPIRTIALEMDVDEGRQYWFRSLRVTGASPTTANYLIAEFDSSLRGKPYDTFAFERFIADHHPDIPASFSPEKDTDVNRDDAHGQIDLTLNIH